MPANVDRLTALGMVPRLAREFARQVNTSTGDARRLMELSMPGPTARYVAAAITAGTASVRRLVEVGLVPGLAKEVVASLGGGTGPVVPSLLIGGLPLGSEGTAGSLYEGYTMSWGDEFTTLDIVGPNKPKGYLTNRGTIALPGNRSSAASAHYYTDPLHTGYNDAGRGVAGITDTMSIVNGGTSLRLRARSASVAERNLFAPSSYSGGKPIIAASAINTAQQLQFFVANGGEIIIEARMRHSPKASNPAGWHPTFWTFSGSPTVESESDETDVIEANSQRGYLNRNTWANGSASTTGTKGPIETIDGNYHIYTAVLTKTECRLYVDGVLAFTEAQDTNAKNRPQYLIWTNVVYLSSYNGENFNAAAWAADPDGADLDIDWTRVWRKTGRKHIKPLVTVADRQTAYAGTTTFTLPPAADIWGSSGLTEYLQCVAGEANDPTNDTKFIGLPPGVTYNSTTRAVTVDWSAASGSPGRLIFNLQAWDTAGSTCEPLTFCVNRGPKISTTAITIAPSSGASIDVYARADVGNLLPKTVEVTGLPSWLAFNATTGLVTGNAPASGSGSFSIKVTNNLGQTVTESVAYNVAASAAVVEQFNDETNAAPVGWTSAWVTSGVDYIEGGGYLRSAVTTTGRHAIREDQSAAAADVEVLCKIRTSRATGTESYIGPVVRGGGAAGSESGYFARLQTASGSLVVSAGKYVNGTLTAPFSGFPTNLSASINTYYWIRMRAVGTTIQVKAWADGASEPTSWQFTGTDNSLASGWVGLSAATAGGNYDCDYLSYTTDGSTAP